MNPPSFHGSKVDEDPQEFIDQVQKVTDIIWVTTIEIVELAATSCRMWLMLGSNSGSPKGKMM